MAMVKLITPLTDVDTAKKFTLGSTTVTKDGNEYIYLAGCSSTVAGYIVTYDEDYATSLVDTDTAATEIGPIAVALASVNSTSYYGWYQIRGEAEIYPAEDITDNVRLYSSATAGAVVDTASGAHTIVGMWSREAGTSGTNFTCQIDYPKIIDVTQA